MFQIRCNVWTKIWIMSWNKLNKEKSFRKRIYSNWDLTWDITSEFGNWFCNILSQCLSSVLVYFLLFILLWKSHFSFYLSNISEILSPFLSQCCCFSWDHIISYWYYYTYLLTDFSVLGYSFLIPPSSSSWIHPSHCIQWKYFLNVLIWSMFSII